MKIITAILLCVLLLGVSYSKNTHSITVEKQELNSALAPHWDAIKAWLESQSKNMSDEAAAFMYMQLATQEFGLE